MGGGGAVRADEIYRRLSERHEITMLCGRYPGARDYEEENIRHIFFGTERDSYILSTFCYAVRTAAFLQANAGRFDVIIEDFAPYNPVFSFLWQKNAVIQVHQREGLRHLKKYNLLGIPFFLIEKFYPRFFGSAVTISEMSRDRYRLKGAAKVVPNGFDPRLLSLVAEEGDYMLFLGRLHIDQKGLDILSEALRCSGGRLVIAGGGKDEARARTLFRDTVESGRAEFAGFVNGSRKADLLKTCLFMVSPSRYEGQPLTMIEAAACSKPVIVSDIPELAYTVAAGFGLSCRRDDPRDLAEKMDLLLQNRSLRQDMGAKAREYAKNFTWDNVAADYEEYLIGVAKKAGRPLS